MSGLTVILRMVTVMLKFLRKLFAPREKVHFIPRLPVGLELSDGDRAALYGWPDYYVQEIIRDE